MSKDYVRRCRVVGRQLKARGNIIANVEGFRPAQTQAVVEEQKLTSGIQIKPDKEDFGSLRYKWEPDEDRPQMLVIGAKHTSIRKYLKELVDGKYPGINSPLYHAVLAEVIAEAFAFRILKKYFIRQGEGGKLDFETANYYYHRELFNFLSSAHKVLVPDSLPASPLSGA